jgi:hypothetical protein
MADRSSQTGGRPTGHPAHRAFARSALWPVRAWVSVQHWTTNKISSLPRIIIIFPLMGLFFTEIENIISNQKTRFNRQIHGLRENFRTLTKCL